MRGNTITIQLEQGRVGQTGMLFQYDRGQRLLITGCELPQSYQVHFSNSELGKSKPMAGDSTGVDIPDEFLQSGQDIHVWVYAATEEHAETQYHGIIHITPRAEPTDIEPTPEQASAIDQIVGALNTALEEVEDLAEGIPGEIEDALAEAKASGDFDGTDGQDGFSPTIEVETITGGHRITVTDANGDQVFDVTDGSKGDTGDTGNGIASAELNEDYTLTLTFDNGDAVTTGSIRGATGAQGETGETGPIGATPDISIGTVTTLDAGEDATVTIDGTAESPVLSFGIPKGPKGDDGDDGVSPTVETEAITGGHTVTITDGSGDHSFNVMDGADGQDGAPGQDGADGADGSDGEDGFSPVVSVTSISGGHTVSITDATGTSTFNVMDGSQGSPGDPTQLIDDTAGSGTTGKTWSANKLATTIGGIETLLAAI